MLTQPSCRHATTIRHALRAYITVGCLLTPLAAVDPGPTSLRLPQVFTDHAVLQRGKPIAVWGWAPAATLVQVVLKTPTATIANAQAVTSGDGSWRVNLAAQPAGGPFSLVTTSGTQTITRTDVLIGDVWLCSGQSNMGLTASFDVNWATTEHLDANYPKIRLLTTSPQKVTDEVGYTEPAQDLVSDKRWSVCTESSAKSFSAVGFFFGRGLAKLHPDLPIGLITAAVGGSPIEAWMPRSALAACGAPAQALLGRYDASVDEYAFADWQDDLLSWQDTYYLKDAGIAATATGWMSPGYDDSTWKAITLPASSGSLESIAGKTVDGALWYRRAITLPASHAGIPLTLEMGAIDDFDQTWVNGVKVGGLGTDVPNAGSTVRSYQVPAALAVSGTMVVAIRAFDRYGPGGMYRSNSIKLKATGKSTLYLNGTWKTRIESSRDAPTKVATCPPNPRLDTCAATHNWNARVAPLLPYTLNGVLWYQGERNADDGRSEQYRYLLAAMIDGWRNSFQQSDFPFLVVQLPNIGGHKDDWWAEARESQAVGAGGRANTAVAVTIDVGDSANVIHPNRKRAVAERLLLLARKQSYGETGLVAAGPVCTPSTGVTISGATVRVTFIINADGLTTSDGAAPRGFSLAGADKKWYPASSASISGKLVNLACAAVPNPVAVRYDWASNPNANLVNSSGLPAAPFRSDAWPLVTAGKY